MEFNMRKIVVINWITLDGYFTDQENPSSPPWVISDPELDKWMMSGRNTMNPNSYLFGRVTYKQFEQVWPNMRKQKNITKEVLQMATSLNKMKKFVFSRTLKETTWENSFLLKGDIVEEVQRLKQENDGDFLIFGSGTVVQQLSSAKLIDEYILVLSPVILGKGKPLFENTNKLNLQLVDSKQFKSGNVLLHY